MAENSLQQYSTSFVAFCRDIFMPIGGKHKPLGDVWDDVQRGLVEKLEPSVLAECNGDVPPRKRFYIEATKGRAKDSLAALLLLFTLLFARRPTRSQVLANDQQQASEVLDIAKQILWANGYLNRMARDVVKIQGSRMVSHSNTDRPQSVVEILTCDKLGSHGSRPDILVCNEISHLSDWGFFETNDANLSKCPHGLGLYLSNAGYIGTPQHAWREKILTDSLFDCTIINTPAPWIDPEVLAHKARTDRPSEHNRLYYGVWASPSGDVLPRELVERAVIYEEPQYRATLPYTYFMSADLSTTTNRSGITVWAVAPDRPIRLAEAISFKPAEYVDRSEFIGHIKAEIRDLVKRFDVRTLAFDQHQSAMLVDLAASLRLDVFEYFAQSKDFDGMKNNATMRAEILFRAFQEGWVHLFRLEQLLLDLKGTSIVTKAGGSKLEFTHDAEGGHGDLADCAATGICIAVHMQQVMRSNLALYGRIEGPRDEVLTAT